MSKLKELPKPALPLITVAVLAFMWGVTEICSGKPFDGAVTQALSLYMLFKEIS